MASDKMVIVNGENWDTEVIGADTTVLVDFWAEWCGPCRAIAPVLEELADELAGKLKICKVDVDQNQQIAGQFGIRSIPTLLVFKDGAVQEQMVGAMSKSAIQEKVSAHL